MARARDSVGETAAVGVLADVAAATERRDAWTGARGRKRARDDGRADDARGMGDVDERPAIVRADSENGMGRALIDASVATLGFGGGGDTSEWDVKFPGQKFGPWAADEMAKMKEIVGRWANEHGFAEEFINEKYDFLFHRRQKQGGRGANLPLSERHAFIELARELPTRNAKQIYGWILRNMDKSTASGKWSKEETELLLKMYDELGPKWSKISKVVGRPAPACRDKWRLAKGGPKKKSGHWSPEETEKLIKLVEAHFEKRGTRPGAGPGQGFEHLTLRDNINWVNISAKLGTRNEQACLQRWYQIAPEMTKTGEWDNKQDSEMLVGLIESNTQAAETIDWENLVHGRNLSQIRRRWNYLSAKVTDHINIPFRELVHEVAKMTKDETVIALAQQYATTNAEN